MSNLPKDMLADASHIMKAIKSLRRKDVMDGLIDRGIAPERIEQTIRDAELAAKIIASRAMSRIAHRKRAKLRIVKS